MVFHALQGVVVPPPGAKLNFPTMGRFLERTTSAGKDGVISWVQVVEDGFGEFVEFAERVEKTQDRFALRPVADGVESAVRSELVE